MANPTPKFRVLLLALRQIGFILSGSVEEYLDMERSRIPNHKKHKKSTVYMRKKDDTITDKKA